MTEHDAPIPAPQDGDHRTVNVRMPAELAAAFSRSGFAWEGLMKLAGILGDGDLAHGLDGVVGVAAAVISRQALDSSLPWVRTLAACQADRMSDEEALLAFRLDGSQLPRLLEFRIALRDGIGDEHIDGMTDPEVTQAEWLLKMMGIKSRLTDQVAAHRERVAEARRKREKARRTAKSGLEIPEMPAADVTPMWISRESSGRRSTFVAH